jgi:cation diffusion facilitator CzcD-associated flavoprotein CzcO
MTAAAEATPPPAQNATGDLPAEVEIAIIGAGFSGLGTAIRLLQEGHTDFAVLERGSDIGGTWWFNTYPGCQCDVPSHLYSFSFAPNPTWTRTYSKQAEIRDYLGRTADRFGVRPYVHCDTAAENAVWDEDAGQWVIETSRGTVRARLVVAGMGPLAEPKIPEVPGLDQFQGEVMHSARWDHEYDLKGKRVASVGTGASAIQYVPNIQPDVEQLYVFQRTAPWIMPHSDRPTTGVERQVYSRFPALQRMVRGLVYSARETLVVGFTKRPQLMGLVEKIARRHIKSSIPDRELRAKVTPDYTIGCKRILPSNRWYPALAEPNVELITGGLKEVRANSVVDRDGNEHEVDAIIFGTGFHVTDMPIGARVRGRDGRTLDDVWQGSPNAYLGTAIPGFPNLFMLLGPNTGLGHSSMIYMIESQIAHVLDALREMKRSDADTVEVRPEVARRYNQRIDKALDGTVWNTGCASWYLDDTGRNATLWPDFTFTFRRRTATFSPFDYALSRRGDREQVAA